MERAFAAMEQHQRHHAHLRAALAPHLRAADRARRFEQTGAARAMRALARLEALAAQLTPNGRTGDE